MFLTEFHAVHSLKASTGELPCTERDGKACYRETSRSRRYLGAGLREPIGTADVQRGPD